MAVGVGMSWMRGRGFFHFFLNHKTGGRSRDGSGKCSSYWSVGHYFFGRARIFSACCWLGLKPDWSLRCLGKNNKKKKKRKKKENRKSKQRIEFHDDPQSIKNVRSGDLGLTIHTKILGCGMWDHGMWDVGCGKKRIFGGWMRTSNTKMNPTPLKKNTINGDLQRGHGDTPDKGRDWEKQRSGRKNERMNE